jgi:hypothetical protein
VAIIDVITTADLAAIAVLMTTPYGIELIAIKIKLISKLEIGRVVPETI